MGRVEVVVERFESAVLKGNPAGDPHVRRLPVVLPPSYADSRRRFPVVYLLTGFMGRGRMMLNDTAWAESIDERFERLIAAGCEEMILVLPDGFTRFGGSQYVNSTATGRYEDHLIQELVPWIDSKYRTLPSRDHRGVAGKSSGGYGALIQGMRHPETFGAVASHSGDVYFEYCYRMDVPRFAAAIVGAGGVLPWLEAFEAKRQKKHEDFTVLNILAMAASYSPDPSSPDLGIALPCDPATGEFREAVWTRWLEHDPWRLAERHADALRSLRLLYLDCGTRDEFHLHLGARLLTRRLRELGVRYEHQEFDDGHMNVTYRYDVSLPMLGRALAASATVRS